MNMTPLKAIRAKCLDCVCGQVNEVRLCPCSDCSLHPYRMGHNPKRAGLGGSFAKKPVSTNDLEDEAAVEGNYIPTVGDAGKSRQKKGVRT